MPIKIQMQIQNLQRPVNSFMPYLASNPNIKKQNIPLNGAMIDRIHTTKPGCSACGKKVM